MLNFNDWSKKDKKEKGLTLTKSSSDLPLQKDDEPILLDDEPVKKKKSIPQQVSAYITRHRDNISSTIK